MKFIKNYKELLLETKVINFMNPTDNFVVMIGGPGSGKDFILDNIINLRNYKEFNVDNFRVSMAKKWWGENWKEVISTDQGYEEMLRQTHKSADPRNRTMKMLRHFLRTDRNHLGNIVYNGGAQVDVIKVIHELAKKAGYETTIVYVETDEKTALERNRKRDRSLPDDMVIDYRDRVNSGKPELMPVFDNVWIVHNNEHLDIKQRPHDRIEKVK